MVALHGGLGRLLRARVGLSPTKIGPPVSTGQISKDQDRNKGAMEQDQQNHGGNTSMQGQLGHRDEDIDLKDADSNSP